MWPINLRPNFFRPSGVRRSTTSQNISASMGRQVIRPHRFWDFHIPRETWDHQSRISYPDDVALVGQHIRHEALRTWISIPDANLPSPWSCNWAQWRLWKEPHPVEVELAVRYGLSDRPLTGIVFNMFDDHSTVFACASSGKFYLYEDGYDDRYEFETLRLSAFDGVFPTVEAFFDDADWNLLQEVGAPAAENIDAGGVVEQRYLSPHKFPAIRMERLRVAADQPYPSRTLWDTCPPKGTFMHKPRVFNRRMPKRLPPAGATWPRIPDAQLPAPWSCAWEEYIHCSNWYNGNNDDPQALLEDMYGVANLVPAMFVPLGNYRGDTVLSTTGGAGTYYLWWNEVRAEGLAEWEGDLQRFEGTYANLEEFIHRADWNRLETLPWRSWDEIENLPPRS
ncbi:hypothetical protein C8R46DRAFT_1119899 [Mycena filopes]|nr:hypothetical protein C8R46DRAFT_1119899 [Mycena filopes]